MTAAAVTGTARAIGYACARRLGRAGHPLVIAGRTADKMQRDKEGL